MMSLTTANKPRLGIYYAFHLRKGFLGCVMLLEKLYLGVCYEIILNVESNEINLSITNLWRRCLLNFIVFF